MTREEAIEILENTTFIAPSMVDVDTALDMAISALSALPEEGAELIDRRQIKWYGCDHEGHIKGINCETADCSKCSFATVEHDEVMSLPVYSIPDSAKTDTAKPESDLISRTQAINDYAQCFADAYGMDCGEMFIGVLHQCPTFLGSADIEKIRTEINIKTSMNVCMGTA